MELWLIINTFFVLGECALWGATRESVGCANLWTVVPVVCERARNIWRSALIVLSIDRDSGLIIVYREKHLPVVCNQHTI